MREADENNTIFRWACKSSAENFKSGSVVFKNPRDGQEMTVLLRRQLVSR